MFKQFGFIMVASVFIPITGTETIQAFLKYSLTSNEFMQQVAYQFLNTSEFFIAYLIQCTFLSNMIAILDIPHHAYLFWKRYTSPFSKIYEIEDDWYFDLGYQYAFSLSIFIIALIYSATVPIIPVIATFFFGIKVSQSVFFCLTSSLVRG